MKRVDRSRLLGYLSALLAVIVAIASRLALDPALGTLFPFATMFLAVLVVASYAGQGPALLATWLGALGTARFLMSPRDDFSISGFENQAGMVLYLVVGTGIALLGGALLSARERAEADADKAVRQREHLRVTLASIGDAVIATDAQGLVTSLNPIAEGLTGWTNLEAVGQPIEEVFRIINEETRLPVKHPVAKVIREGVIVGLANHTILITRDGTRETPIEDSAAPIRDDRGTLVGVVMVFRDVAAQKATQVELKRSEARKAAILQTSLDAIITIDAAGDILDWNPAAATIFDRDRGSVMGKEMCALIIPPSLREAHRRGMEHYRASGEGPVLGRRFEITAVRSDGSEFPIELSIARIPGEGPLVFTAHIRDITKRKANESALRQSEKQFRTMAESIPQLAWMARPDGNVYWYNKRWYDYTGTTPEQMQGWGWQSVHDPEMLPKVMERWQGSIASGEPFDMEFPLRDADGHFRPFLTRVMPVWGDDGQIVDWFGTNTDIADRRTIEDELKAAKVAAEGANQAKTQFLAVLSHELRTPLNPILLATSAMLEQPVDPEDIRSTLEMIRQNVNLQARLIDDLLDVMKIVRGKMPLHWEVADGHKLIEQAIQICRSELFGGEYQLVLDLAAKQTHVNADAARIQQVMWNLIKNAVKFTPHGGTIVIRTRNEVGVDGSSDRLIIEVIDTGIGIVPEVLPRIFDPFQQGETTMTRKYGGLGLGLAISRGIVEAHGGSIVAESTGPDLGTTFTINLPTLPEPEPEGNGQATDRISRADAATLSRILVVEDEPATLRLMARLLAGLGHEVTTASTVATAMDRVETGVYDLIVSDIGLPDGTGLDLMRRIIVRRGPMPAIALTGYGSEDDIRRSRDAGFTVHMTKPIDFNKLEAMIRQVSTTQDQNKRSIEKTM